MNIDVMLYEHLDGGGIIGVDPNQLAIDRAHGLGIPIKLVGRRPRSDALQKICSTGGMLVTAHAAICTAFSAPTH